MNGSIDEIVHMGRRLNGQGVVGKARPGRDVGRHFTGKLALLVRSFRKKPVGPLTKQTHARVVVSSI